MCAIVTLEKENQYVLMKKISAKTSDLTYHAIKTLLKPFKDLYHMITSDNGKEFACHELVSQFLNTKVYFTPVSLLREGFK